MDFIVAGLGNPGREYEMSRHNAGFLALDLLAKQLGVPRLKLAKFRALYEICKLDNYNILLMKPQTYMNLSGDAIAEMANAFAVPPEKIVVLYDDISLPAGHLRIRKSGSAGGHNGIKSMILRLNSDCFPRVKIGVGEPARAKEDLKDYVLSTLDSEAYEGVRRAPNAAVELIRNGVEAAMQGYNGAAKA